MTAAELRDFIFGRTVQARDPESGALVATVSYLADGTCRFARPGSDAVEQGVYGLAEREYWTRYTAFREGKPNSFYLVALAPDRAQAYHSDGRRAYLLVQQPGHGRRASGAG
ncbi:MAG: hypothetical protein RIB84_29335 [Sneathiellaceae bacterium]